jgi:hypothetical protein
MFEFEVGTKKPLVSNISFWVCVTRGNLAQILYHMELAGKGLT